MMLLIGLVLLAAAAVVGADVASQNDLAIDVQAFGQTFSTTAGGLFTAGAVVALVGAFGLLMMRDGLIRLRTRRAELRGVREERDHLAEAMRGANTGNAREVDLRERQAEKDREHVTTF